MTIPDPSLAGYSEAAATVFTWLADKVLGRVKQVKDWTWDRAQWAAAQDRYDAQIIKQYGWIRIFGQTTPKPLKEIFTDVYMLDKPTAFSRFDPGAIRDHLRNQDRGAPWRTGERLPAEELLGRGNKFFILGRPGAGKTTFLKRLAVREAQRGAWGPCLGKIPIFVPLKQFAESGKTLLDFIVEQFAVCHFPDAAPFVVPLLQSGKALVLFDGLDEVTKVADPHDGLRGLVTELIEQIAMPAATRHSYRSGRDQVTKLIDEFSRQYDLCHIVVTCLIAATEYTFPPPFIYLEVADFAPDQVDEFVRNWFWDPAEPDRSAGLAEKMLVDYEQPEHAGIRDLARNPLLLTLLCIDYAETLSFPARRVEVYQEALDALLKKWDTSRQIQRGNLYRTLSLGRKQQMFSRIAYDGFIQGEILFAQADLGVQLKAYLLHLPEVHDAVDIDAEAVLREIVEQHGIFAEQSRGLFSFAHLTFQEYYAARHILESSAIGSLEILVERITDDKWREVMLLTASLWPDATPFLAAFEKELYRLVISRPRLVDCLHWIDEQAAASKATYRRLATRFWYASSLHVVSVSGRDAVFTHLRDFACVFDHDLDHARAFDAELDNARARDRERARDYARALNLSLNHGLDLDLAAATKLARGRTLSFTRSPTRVQDLIAILERVRYYCQQLGYATLDKKLSTLVLPSSGASQDAWLSFATQLAEIRETRDALNRYVLLEAETIGHKLSPFRVCQIEQSR